MVHDLNISKMWLIHTCHTFIWESENMAPYGTQKRLVDRHLWFKTTPLAILGVSTIFGHTELFIAGTSPLYTFILIFHGCPMFFELSGIRFAKGTAVTVVKLDGIWWDNDGIWWDPHGPVLPWAGSNPRWCSDPGYSPLIESNCNIYIYIYTVYNIIYIYIYICI